MALSDSLYLGATVVLFVVSIAGLALLHPGSVSETVPGPADYRISPGGERYTVATDELRSICPGDGCIPPITTPTYVSPAAASWLDAGSLVIGIEAENASYAFPVSVVQMHGVVNTEIDGFPVAVTYSPYSAVSRAFHRTVDGDRLTFEHAGELYNGNMVMRDQETGTRWSQFRLAAIRGSLVPMELGRVETAVVPWGIWERRHPETKVLSHRTGIFNASTYLDEPYYGYRHSRTAPVDRIDEALHPKKIVYGLSAGGEARAYRATHVQDIEVINDRVGGVPVVVVQNERSGTVMAFRRRVAGTTVRFAKRNGTLVDAATGNAWTWDGVAIEGEHAGTALDEIPMTRMYWFAWDRFHPDTSIYQPEG